VIIDRVMTLLSLVLMSAVGLPWLFDIVTDPVARWTFALVIASGALLFAALIALSGLRKLMTRWQFLRPVIALAALGRKTALDLRYALPVILLSVASFVVFACIVFMLAREMRLNVSLLDCVLLVPPVILVTVVPVSIAGWGVREGAMVIAFGFLHVPASAAFALSVLFGLTLAVASLPGSIIWWLSGYRAERAAEAAATAADRPA
jgi:glycosyltransferase 2 family protein